MFWNLKDIYEYISDTHILYLWGSLISVQGNDFMIFLSKPSLKIRTPNAICWNYRDLFRDYGLNYIFFRNKPFFFKKESWNFQHLFEKEFRESSQNFNSIRQWIEKKEIKIVWITWMSWNFVRFHEILFQTDAENFSFLSWKTKKFYSKKIYNLGRSL